VERDSTEASNATRPEALALLGEFEGHGYLVERGTVEMPEGNAFVLSLLLGPETKSFGRALGKARAIGVANVSLVEMAVRAAGVVERARLATQAKPVKSGENKTDRGTETG
jgi:hypothetical protein